MKKEKSIQADIEVLKEIMQHEKKGTIIPGSYSKLTIPALTSAIFALEAMRDASDALPEKMEKEVLLKTRMASTSPSYTVGTRYNPYEAQTKEAKEAYRHGQNDYRDLCQPTVSKLLKENKELQQQLHEYKLAATAEADKVDELTKENKSLNRDDDEDGCVGDCVIVHSLKDRLNNWIHELAYYTEEEIATPEGVKAFIGKALDDKTKEIKELREGLERNFQKGRRVEIEAQPKPLSKSLSKEQIEEIVLFLSGGDNTPLKTLTYNEMLDVSKMLASAIYNAQPVKPLSREEIEKLIWDNLIYKKVIGMSFKKSAEAIYKEMNAQSNPTERSR